MKKLNVQAIIKTCFFTSLFFYSMGAYSQILLPQEWETFIDDPKQNISVRDTFRYQCFEGTSQENWKYTEQGTKRVHIDEQNITGQAGDYILQMNSGSEISFESFDISNYNEVQISFRTAGKMLPKNASVRLLANRALDQNANLEFVKSPSDNYSFTFYDKLKGDKEDRIQPLKIASGPTDLRIIASQWNGNGFYYIDSLIAYGLIP